jgi:hypothetical protein
MRRGTHHHRRRQRALVGALQFVLSLLRQPNDAAMPCVDTHVSDVFKRSVMLSEGCGKYGAAETVTLTPVVRRRHHPTSRPTQDLLTQEYRELLQAYQASKLHTKKESTSLREQDTRAVRCSRYDSRAARSLGAEQELQLQPQTQCASRSNWST